MNDFERSPGRALEIAAGVITWLIALLFASALVVTVVKLHAGLLLLAISLALSAATYWFAQLGYRLILNKHRKDGGLFSVIGLRIWCQLFGVISISECAWAIYQQQPWLFSAGAVMAAACLFGLRIATARAAIKK